MEFALPKKKMSIGNTHGGISMDGLRPNFPPLLADICDDTLDTAY
jgi:hypothetical protein